MDQEQEKTTLTISLPTKKVARGTTVLPKSVTESRIKSNLEIVDLDESDLKTLADITAGGKVERFVYPPFGINFGFPDKSEGKVMPNGADA